MGRIVQVKFDGWLDTTLNNVKVGDVVRFVDDGKMYIDERGQSEFEVVAESYMHPELNVETINVK